MCRAVVTDADTIAVCVSVCLVEQRAAEAVCLAVMPDADTIAVCVSV